ncbi:MAG: Uncharacterised protein [Synechococcus sp. CC9902]|nr:MAG: Uncharacterised protein [Synechococcus sp. CC9902]
MEWTGKGADGGGHHGVGVGEGAGGDPGTEGAGVEAVLRMQHQAAVKNARRERIRFTLSEHVEKVGGVSQIVPGLDGILPFSDQLEGRHHRRNLGNQTNNSVIDVLGVINGPAGIKQPQGSRTRLQRIHRVATGREALHHVPNTEADPAVHLHCMLKISKLIRAGQVTPDQQVGRFQKTAVGRQILHRVTAIGEQALLTIDVAD